MRLVFSTVLLVTMSFGALAQTVSASYWFFLKDGGHTWCGYTEMVQFTSDVMELKPAETVGATYSSDKLLEVTYQIEPQSGDWIVVDKYTPADGGLTLRRANLLAQNNLQIVEETSIHGGKAEPFHVLSTTTLDGKKAEASNVDLPDVSVRTGFSGEPFLAVVSEMRKQSVSKLCKTF
jgi:hypothetical protein